MELRQLRYFIAIAECLSFSKAAQQLHVTVPPLSRQIRQLEEEFGVQLFVRDRRRVALTDAGRLLLREARAVVTQTAHVSDCVRMAKIGQTGRVRVGIGMSLGERVSQVVIEHTKRFPAVEIECREICSTLQNEVLLGGDIDVGFLRPSIDPVHLDSELLFEERLLVHVNKSSPLAKRKALRMQDLAGESLLLHDREASSGLYDKAVELYRNAGLTPNIIPLPKDPTPHGDVQSLLVACRKGIFIMPDEVSCHPAPGGEVVAVPLDEPDATIGVYMAWRTGEKSMPVHAFLDSARTVFGTAAPREGLGCAARRREAAV